MVIYDGRKNRLKKKKTNPREVSREKHITKEVAYYNYTPATHDNSDNGRHIE